MENPTIINHTQHLKVIQAELRKQADDLYKIANQMEQDIVDSEEAVAKLVKSNKRKRIDTSVYYQLVYCLLTLAKEGAKKWNSMNDMFPIIDEDCKLVLIARHERHCNTMCPYGADGNISAYRGPGDLEDCLLNDHQAFKDLKIIFDELPRQFVIDLTTIFHGGREGFYVIEKIEDFASPPGKYLKKMPHERFELERLNDAAKRYYAKVTPKVEEFMAEKIKMLQVLFDAKEY